MKIYEYVNEKVIDSQQSIYEINETIKTLMHNKNDLVSVGLLQNEDIKNRLNKAINELNLLHYDLKIEVERNIVNFKVKGVFDKN